MLRLDFAVYFAIQITDIPLTISREMPDFRAFPVHVFRGIS